MRIGFSVLSIFRVTPASFLNKIRDRHLGFYSGSISAESVPFIGGGWGAYRRSQAECDEHREQREEMGLSLN